MLAETSNFQLGHVDYVACVELALDRGLSLVEARRLDGSMRVGGEVTTSVASVRMRMYVCGG